MPGRLRVVVANLLRRRTKRVETTRSVARTKPRKPRRFLMIARLFRLVPDTSLREKWAEQDSNLRRLSPVGLQPTPFGSGGTDKTSAAPMRSARFSSPRFRPPHPGRRAEHHPRGRQAGGGRPYPGTCPDVRRPPCGCPDAHPRDVNTTHHGPPAADGCHTEPARNAHDETHRRR